MESRYDYFVVNVFDQIKFLKNLSHIWSTSFMQKIRNMQWNRQINDDQVKNNVFRLKCFRFNKIILNKTP